MTAMRLKRYPSPSGGFALGKMGVGATMLKQGKTARDYVQDGLVAMWDVTSLRGETWKDLVGNHDFTVGTGVTTVGNMVQFTNGSGCTSNWQMAPEDIMTFEVVLKMLSVPSSGGASTFGVFSSQFTQSNYQVPYRLLNVRNINNEIYIKNTGYLGYSCAPKVNPNGVATLAWTYTTNAHVPSASYKDGVSISTTHNFGASSEGNAFIKGGSVTTFEIGCIRSYSRALTADEIAANYRIDKERFNLP